MQIQINHLIEIHYNKNTIANFMAINYLFLREFHSKCFSFSLQPSTNFYSGKLCSFHFIRIRQQFPFSEKEKNTN